MNYHNLYKIIDKMGFKLNVIYEAYNKVIKLNI